MISSLDILYLGHNFGTSGHRAEALRRLGYKVKIIDPWLFFPKSKILQKIIEKLVYEIGACWIEPYVGRRIAALLNGCHAKLTWSDQCTFIGPKTASVIKSHSDFMVTYAIDDPFGPRDKNRFKLYRQSLSRYDLMAVLREQNEAEAYIYGVPKVLRIPKSADEVGHRPIVMTEAESKCWASDVAFIGTWMPERGPFLKRLIELGIPLTLYGDRWHKAPEWPTLKGVWRGPGLVEEDYVKGIQSAKVCLGLVSKSNRDLHTTRSSEIPYIGSLLCAERTSEHLCMYDEDIEAVFWSTPEECAQKCIDLIANGAKRKAIAQAGRRRCVRSGYLNEPILDGILKTLYQSKPDKIGSMRELGCSSP
jgi:spore maturation protein CgeB